MIKPFATMRPLMSNATLAAGVALSFGSTAFAQTAPVGAGEPIVLDTVTLQGGSLAQVPNTNRASTKIARLPATVRETPRTVNVVPQEVLEKQGVTSLEQALRNVPGITLSSGEGNGGQNGDQFRIRGFQSKGDVYTNGLKDFGAYVRDSFNTESVEVFKGPTGGYFGAGNVGGVINQSTKGSFLEDRYGADYSIGSGPTHRGTFDLNKTLSETSAVRVNGVVHRQDVEDRDRVETDREGIAVDLGLGLGTPTEWHLNYSYQGGDRTPDMGVPMLRRPGTTGAPATEFGLDRSTSYSRVYGNSEDRDETNVHTFTSNLTHTVNENIAIHNDTRVQFYDRDFLSTNPSCEGACVTTFFNGGNPLISYGAGGGIAYRQDGTGVQNVTSADVNGTIGGLRNELKVGLDVSHQSEDRERGSFLPARPTNVQRLRDPVYEFPTALLTYDNAIKTEGTAFNAGLFATDRIWLTEEFSLLGGVRADYFESTSVFSGVEAKDDVTALSPSISAIYEPTKATQFYATFARSYAPVGVNLSTQQMISTSEAPRAGSNFDPERSDLYEIGTKIDLLGEALGFSGSVFQIEKKNSVDTDPTSGIAYAFGDAGDTRRVRGFELGLNGEVLTGWTVHAGYAYLDGEILSTAYPEDQRIVGDVAPYVSRHNVTLWTDYDLTPHLPDIGGDLSIAGGLRAASSYAVYTPTVDKNIVPDSFSLDAAITYDAKHFKVALNGYNLTDHLNYDAAFGGRAVPASGRSVLLTIGAKF